jgi:hypothetical protein
VDDEVVSVAELHRTLLPYHICRNTLGYTTKAEYDVELLELLATEQFLFPAENELRSAVSVERTSPEPSPASIDSPSSSDRQMAEDEGGKPAERAESRTPQPEAIGAGTAVCWRCQKALPDRAGLRYCVFCGSDQQRPCCLACDEELDGDWRFCPRCGTDCSAAADSA